MERYKQGFYFSDEFVGDRSWNGYEHNCLFVNVGGGQFLDLAYPLGADGIRDGRGVAVADFDGDGRPDLVVANSDARPTVYLNRLSAGNWIDVELVGRRGSPDAVGARVRVRLAAAPGRSARTLTRWVEAGSGYASQSDFPLHFGLGEATAVEAVEILWPGGASERFPGSAFVINRRTRIEEGHGNDSESPGASSPR